MSAAEQTEGHDEEEVLHQAGWVYFTTYATCLGFLALFMLINPRVEGYVPGAAILWFTLVSIPAQIYLARREWGFFAGTLGLAVAGFYALPYVVIAIGWAVLRFGDLLGLLV